VKEGFERVEEKSDKIEEKSDQVVEYDLNKDLKDDSIYTEEGKISAISGLEEVENALEKEDDFQLEAIEEKAEKIENVAEDVKEAAEEAKKTGKVEDDEKVAEKIDDTIDIIIEPREELIDKLLEGDNGAVSVALVEIKEQYDEIMEKMIEEFKKIEEEKLEDEEKEERIKKLIDEAHEELEQLNQEIIDALTEIDKKIKELTQKEFPKDFYDEEIKDIIEEFPEELKKLIEKKIKDPLNTPGQVSQFIENLIRFIESDGLLELLRRNKVATYKDLAKEIESFLEQGEQLEKARGQINEGLEENDAEKVKKGIETIKGILKSYKPNEVKKLEEIKEKLVILISEKRKILSKKVQTIEQKEEQLKQLKEINKQISEVYNNLFGFLSGFSSFASLCTKIKVKRKEEKNIKQIVNDKQNVLNIKEMYIKQIPVLINSLKMQIIVANKERLLRLSKNNGENYNGVSDFGKLLIQLNNIYASPYSSLLNYEYKMNTIDVAKSNSIIVLLKDKKINSLLNDIERYITADDKYIIKSFSNAKPEIIELSSLNVPLTLDNLVDNGSTISKLQSYYMTSIPKLITYYKMFSFYTNILMSLKMAESTASFFNTKKGKELASKIKLEEEKRRKREKIEIKKEMNKEMKTFQFDEDVTKLFKIFIKEAVRIKKAYAPSDTFSEKDIDPISFAVLDYKTRKRIKEEASRKMLEYARKYLEFFKIYAFCKTYQAPRLKEEEELYQMFLEDLSQINALLSLVFNLKQRQIKLSKELPKINDELEFLDQPELMFPSFAPFESIEESEEILTDLSNVLAGFIDLGEIRDRNLQVHAMVSIRDVYKSGLPATEKLLLSILLCGHHYSLILELMKRYENELGKDLQNAEKRKADSQNLEKMMRLVHLNKLKYYLLTNDSKNAIDEFNTLTKLNADLNDYSLHLEGLNYELDIDTLKTSNTILSSLQGIEEINRKENYKILDPKILQIIDVYHDFAQIKRAKLILRSEKDQEDDKYKLAKETLQIMIERWFSTKEELSDTKLHFIPFIFQLFTKDMIEHKFRWSAYKGHIKTLEVMLDNLRERKLKFDINSKDKKGNTALHKAVINGSEEIVSLLLKNGADVNVKDIDGMTPLFLASMLGNENIIKLLLENNADPNARDKEKRTAIFYAILRSTKLKNAKEVVKILLRHGADVNVANENGRTLLHLAVSHVDLNLIKPLVENGADINAKDKNGRTILYDAITSVKKENEDKIKEIIKYLLEKGASPNETIRLKLPLNILLKERIIGMLSYDAYKARGVKDEDNIVFVRSPLSTAIEMKNLELVKLLVEHGADVNPKFPNPNPLSEAVAVGSKEIVSYLIEKGADVNKIDDMGFAPVHNAVFKEVNSEILTLLLEHGANPDIKDPNGETPLFYAVRNRDPEKVKILLDHGARLNVTNNKGETPYIIGMQVGFQPISLIAGSDDSKPIVVKKGKK
jgi:ankyrin repeat protein